MITYEAMIQILLSGRRVPADVVDAACRAAGVTPGRLAIDLIAGRTPGRRSGDPCPACREGRLRVTSSKRRAGRVVRYLGCTEPACTFTAKVIVRDDQVPRRPARR